MSDFNHRGSVPAQQRAERERKRGHFGHRRKTFPKHPLGDATNNSRHPLGDATNKLRHPLGDTTTKPN